MRAAFLPLLLLLSLATSIIRAQDTLSFGGLIVADLPEAEVRAVFEPVSPLASTFTIEEVKRLAGTFYDPARLVALLPGVVQTNDQANHLSVRGNTPNANLWRLNGLAIVNPNHTANAGTILDLPALTGGGVNAISAQMLNNSAFLAGGLPAEYGFATGGTFDLRLRPGDRTEFKPQVQAGFIGIDLAAEGPIGQSGRTSYLVNGRYSFTGLLGAAGVDFGGEEISFWDLNASISHITDRGSVTGFAIIGGSKNIFEGPEDPAEFEEEKDLYGIDYESDLSIVGANFEVYTGKNKLRGGMAYSTVSPVRDQRTTSDLIFTDPYRVRARLDHGRTSVLLAYELENLTFGYEGLFEGTRYRIEENEEIDMGQSDFLDQAVDAHAPFVNYFLTGKNWEANLGFRSSIYRLEQETDVTFEPRISAEYHWNNQRFVVNAERTSMIPTAQLLSYNSLTIEPFAPVTNQLSLAYGRKIGGVSLLATPFFQFTPDEYAYGAFDNVGDVSTWISANSFYELDPNFQYNGTTSTRRYGLELEAAGGKRIEGWYYRGSLTLLRAETEQSDGSYDPDRYSPDFIGKLALGREWPGSDKKERSRTFGLNLTLIAHGGERAGVPIRTAPEFLESNPFPTFRAQFIEQGLVEELGAYFRPDLRLYKTKVRPKTNTTLALDIQNLAGVENVSGRTYDIFTGMIDERTSLGIIPVLSYRIEWR